MSKIYFNSDHWKVTDSLVRTPKKSFSLEKLDAVSLKRTFFLFVVAPATGSILITLFWWRYLYAGEIAFILIAALTSLIFSFQFGTLKVDALSLKDDEGGTVYGRYSHLALVRDAIELAMQESHSTAGEVAS